MATQKLLPIFISSINGGMNDKDAPWILSENVVELAENLDISRLGQASRRNGVADYGMRTDKPYGLWRAHDGVLDQESLFSIYAGNIYITTAQGEMNQRASGVSMADSLHQTHQARHAGRVATFINSAQVADSNASLASSLTVITDNNLYTQAISMAPRCAVWWQNRMWCADNVRSQTEETLWWSELEDGIQYSTFNTALIESGKGGRIKALLPIRAAAAPQMLVFKERAVAVIETYWGSSSSLIPIAADALDPIRSSIKLVTENAGCVATNSIQFVPGAPGGDVYFLSIDGVRAISRAADDTLSGAGIPLSDPIQSTVDRINFEHADKAVSAVYKDSYYLAVPLDGAIENTHILQFNMKEPGWSIHTWKAKALAVSRLNQTQNQMWMQYNTSTFDCSVSAQASGYHLFQCFTNLDDPDSTPVIFKHASRAFIGKDVNRKKRWDHISVLFRNDSTATMTVALEYNVDNSSWVTFASLVAGGTADGSVVLGETPLPWGLLSGLLQRKKFSLSDISTAYTLQLRMTGQSDLAQPVFFNTGVYVEELSDEFDNETT
jgi:hypothetical protein